MFCNEEFSHVGCPLKELVCSAEERKERGGRLECLLAEVQVVLEPCPATLQVVLKHTRELTRMRKWQSITCSTKHVLGRVPVAQQRPVHVHQGRELAVVCSPRQVLQPAILSLARRVSYSEAVIEAI